MTRQMKEEQNILLENVSKNLIRLDITLSPLKQWAWASGPVTGPDTAPAVNEPAEQVNLSQAGIWQANL